jgi:hypothetical protein
MRGPTPAGESRRAAREDVVGFAETIFGHDLANVRRRSGDRNQAGIGEFAVQIVREIWIGVDGQERCIGCQALEDVLREGADARAIFDEQLAGCPVDRLKHPVDQYLRGGDHRSHHHRMLDESPKELPERPARATAGEGAIPLCLIGAESHFGPVI